MDTQVTPPQPNPKRLVLRHLLPSQRQALLGGALLGSGVAAWALTRWLGPMLSRTETLSVDAPAPFTEASPIASETHESIPATTLYQLRKHLLKTVPTKPLNYPPISNCPKQ
jgi:hypothetical protein